MKRTTFMGKPCKREHSGLRYTSSNGCVECSKHSAKLYEALPETRERRRLAAYKYNNLNRTQRNLDKKKYRKTLKGRLATYKERGYPEPTRAMPEVCECCGKQHKRTLCLDHCHETHKFRGWLCINCNSILGRLGDDIEGARKLVSYLERT
jgi:hypothetical protein